MLILYILLVAYILAVNFYAFVLVKSLRDKERETAAKQNTPTFFPPEREAKDSFADNASNLSPTTSQTQPQAQQSQQQPTAPTQEKCTGKLCITGLLGGAIAIYVCMFVFKFKRTDLLLMVIMPLLGVLNVYLWVLLFRSGFSFFVLR